MSKPMTRKKMQHDMEYDIKDCNVYLSGPVSGCTRDELHNTFGVAAKVCEYNGAKNVFNPPFAVPKTYTHELAMLRCINELSMFDWEQVEPKPFYDFLIQLDCWRYSEGAILEAKVADALGIQIISIHEMEWPDE